MKTSAPLLVDPISGCKYSIRTYRLGCMFECVINNYKGELVAIELRNTLKDAKRIALSVARFGQFKTPR